MGVMCHVSAAEETGARGDPGLVWGWGCTPSLSAVLPALPGSLLPVVWPVTPCTPWPARLPACLHHIDGHQEGGHGRGAHLPYRLQAGTKTELPEEEAAIGGGEAGAARELPEGWGSPGTGRLPRLQPSALWGSRPHSAEGSQMKSEKEGFHRLVLTQGGPEATGLWENTEPHW